MKKIISALVIGLLLILALKRNAAHPTPSSPARPMQQLTDMAGRTVVLPRTVERIYTATPLATEIIYTIQSERLIGRTFKTAPAARPFLNPDFLAKPVLGGWYGNGVEGNYEEIMLHRPDLVIFSSYTEPTPKMLDQVSRIQHMLHCPVVVIDGRLKQLPQTYRFLGRVLAAETRCEALAAYAEQTLAATETARARIQQPVRVYYAEGPSGLQTDPAGSLHTLVLDLVGAENVAKLELSGGIGRILISPEQLIQWDPELILVCPENGLQGPRSNYNNLLNNPALRSLQAIKTGQIYRVPSIPFNILDRPPSIGRLLGLQWTGKLLYPDLYAFDMEEVVRRFYHLFYHIHLTEEQIHEILHHAKSCIRTGTGIPTGRPL
jgi:iron complex transport system substrate-binding protein